MDVLKCHHSLPRGVESLACLHQNMTCGHIPALTPTISSSSVLPPVMTPAGIYGSELAPPGV